MRTLLFIFIGCLLLLLNTCTDNPINGDDNISPGRRDYEWTVDTLYSPNNVIKRLWGSSENDVWAVGPGGITAYDGLWHFDGTDWEPYQQALLISPECIYGFAENDIWIAGNDGKIFHYDGNSWIQSFIFTKPETIGTHINDIWGGNPQDIYAIGRLYINPEPLPRSFILHFDGTFWKEIYFSSKQLQFFKVQKEDNKLFLSGIILTQTSKPDTLFFYKMENNIVMEIYRNTIDKIAFLGLSQIGDKTYFLIGQNLFRYINGNFLKVISFNEELFGYQAFGRNEKDIFLSMKNGLSHYNGENVEYLYQFSNSFTGVWPYPVNLPNNVFFVAHDNLNDLNLILRGKIKE